MNRQEKACLLALFQQAHIKCFGSPFTNVLSEAAAKHLSVDIQETTGLVLGWKSLKNYAAYLISEGAEQDINPSIPSLDTLVRYIQNAPPTDEGSRKKFESHYPYWFDFKEQELLKLPQSSPSETATAEDVRRTGAGFLSKKLLFVAAPLVLITLSIIYFPGAQQQNFTENFESPVQLLQNGWIIKNPDTVYWQQRQSQKSRLTLFTLAGDKTPVSESVTAISNILLRKFSAKSFATELYISDFVPAKNWQQTGLLLMEDTTANTRAVRFSIGYNDFFGGYQKPGEIILQVLYSSGGHSAKPEEIIESTLFQKTDELAELVKRNLQKSALRIEKKGNHYRFLYATGEKDIFAFKEIKSREIDFTPRYIGIYASSGNNPEAAIAPVHIEKFMIKK